MLYSIVETAAACGAHVYYYLKYLLEEIPKYLNGTQLEFLEDIIVPDSIQPGDSTTNTAEERSSA